MRMDPLAVSPKPMGGGPQPIIRDEIAATLRRLLEADNHLTLVECRDQLAAETGARGRADG